MKNVALVLVACLTLVACAPKGEPMPVDLSEPALSEWIDRGFPAGACEYQVTALRLIETSLADIHSESDGICPAGIEACFVDHDGEPPTIYYSVDQTTDPREVVLEHELRHWLGACSGLGIDPEHTHPTMWYGVMYD
jgi:hypothetical protein